MTINSSFKVDGVTFSSTGLNFDYVASGGGSFSMAGTAGVNIGGVNGLTVTIGAGGNPGLVIDNGSLSSLDATINSNFELDGLTFNASGLTFDYLASGGGMFTMSGTAGVTIGSVDNLSATFGASGSPGLVISNGSLSGLDMTIDSTFEVDDVTIDAKHLNFDYLRRTAAVLDVGDGRCHVGGVAGLTATFGASGTPGLVLDGGNLSDLDMTINSNFEVADVTFNATNLNFDYVAANDSFSMAGTVGATVGGSTTSRSPSAPAVLQAW